MMRSYYEFNKDDAIEFARVMNIQTVEKRDELQFRYCPYCGGGRKGHDKDTFSINLKTGVFQCMRGGCGHRGNMITLSRDFRDYGFRLPNDADMYYHGNHKKFKNAREKIESKEPAIKYMESRMISEETCKKYEITTYKDDEKTIVFPFRDESGELCFVKYRNIEPKEGQSKEWCLKDEDVPYKKILFGMSQCNPEECETLIITEGQIDSLSVAECGFTNAVSVPLGKNTFTWVPNCWDFVNKFRDIIVFGDLEKGEMSLLDEIKIRFGRNHGIKSVRIEDYIDCKDANDIIRKYGKEQIEKCIENAEPVPIKRVKDLSKLKLSDLQNQTYLETGIRKLDKTLRGGLPFGGVTVVTGKAGEGKSTLCSQILLMAIDRGHKCFSYSGELSALKFKEWMYFQAAGEHHVDEYTCNRWGDKDFVVKESAVEKIDRWMSGRMFYYDYEICDGDDEEDEVLTDTIENAINQYGVDVILLDNLMTAMYMNRTEGADRFDIQSKFMHKITKLAMKYNVVIILVAHKKKASEVNGNDDIAGSSNIGNLASTIISFGKSADDQYKSKRKLSITKNRLFGTSIDIATNYEEKSRRIYETDYERNRSFDWQIEESINALDRNGIEYEVDDSYDDIPF